MTIEPYGKKNPFPATVLDVTHITKEGSAKETIHISFDLTGSGLEYETGDALAVIPTNDPVLVDALIAQLGFCPNAPVPSPDCTEISLRDALINCYDIACVNKGVLTKWSAFSANEKLQEVLAAEDKKTTENFCWGCDILDLVTACPACFPDAVAFVSVLKKMLPRLYSIASSPNAHPGQVQLCVGAVRYTCGGRQRGGVCSTFMADRVGKGCKAKVFVHSNKNFRLPEDKSLPIIMVGPGTGIAPFRAFWEERVVSGASGGNWLFFGNPYQATDFCYEDELGKLTAEGKLKLSVAWSRDQAEKIYVQHLMEREGGEIWSWLEKGACFYVCGDASRMAKDVDAALISLVAKHGGKSDEDAAAYVDAMRKSKRYQRDVY